MAKVKKGIKKAQNGKEVVTERKLMPKFIDLERARMKGPSEKIDTTARNAAIKRGEFREDPKSGDLFPIKKKAKSGASLKPVAPAKKKSLGQLPEAVRRQMGYQKNGGKMMKSIKQSKKK